MRVHNPHRTQRFEIGGGLHESSRQDPPGPGPMMSNDRGFSMANVMVVAGITLILVGLMLPQIQSMVHAYALAEAGREIAGQISLVRMRATAVFAPARMVVNTAAGSYQNEICTTKNPTTGGCSIWTAESGTQHLPSGISFGHGSISIPASPQTTIGQASTIIFNARGITINTENNPTTNDALYLTNIWGQYCAVTVDAGGKPTIWEFNGTAWEEI